jgi:Flp pilus assembly protein TadD
MNYLNYPGFIGILYCVKALALKGMNRNNDALAAIDKALALEPENAHYWHVKGNLLAANGNCSGAPGKS